MHRDQELVDDILGGLARPVAVNSNPMPLDTASAYNQQLESRVHGLLMQLSVGCWPIKEQTLHQLSVLLPQQSQEAQEALLRAGPAAVLDDVMAVMVSSRTQQASKIMAADLVPVICSDSKAYLLLSPNSIVERLMRCAYKGDADMKAAAARALWQLSCHQDFSPEVVSHAGNAFKVVDMLAADMQGGSSNTCLCALRAAQNLLYTYGSGDASDRIGGKVIQPLCNLLDPAQPEAAAAAAELLAILSSTAQNHARIVAAGGIPRLVALLRAAGSNPSNTADVASPQQQQQCSRTAAAAAGVQALAQLARGDVKLCTELLGANIVPGLLQVVSHRECCAGALSLLGDLVALPEGWRALQNANGFAALTKAAQGCCNYQLCRLLSKATKGCKPAFQDFASLLDSTALIQKLVECCSPNDRKTRKRAMQVLLRLLQHGKAIGKPQQLQAQLLSLGLLQYIQQLVQQALQPDGASSRLHISNSVSTAGNIGSNQSVKQELQLALALLQELANWPAVVAALLQPVQLQASAPPATPAAAIIAASTTAAHRSCSRNPAHEQLDAPQPDQRVKQASQLSAMFEPRDAHGVVKAIQRESSAEQQATIADISHSWRHSAAAAAAAATNTTEQCIELEVETHCSRVYPRTDTTAAAVTVDGPCDSQASSNPQGPSLLQLLQQLLLTAGLSGHLQQLLLQVVAALTGLGDARLLQDLRQQGWVPVLWSFLPGGRQLLAIVYGQSLLQHLAEPDSLGASQSAIVLQIATGGSSSGADSSSTLQLLQGMEDALPSVEQTEYALQALAHLCSCPATAAQVVHMQLAYQAAASKGLLGSRSLQCPQQVQQQALPCFDDVFDNYDAGMGHQNAAAVVAMLFGNNPASSSTPTAVQAAQVIEVPAGKGRALSTAGDASELPTPQCLPSTPRSMASSISSGSSAAASQVSAVGSSSSGLSSSSGGGGGSSIVRASSSSLLSRLGLGRTSSQQRPNAAAAIVDAKQAASQGGVVAAAEDTVVSGTAAVNRPVEDPGSPIQTLVTLLAEPWAAVSTAGVLAHLAAADPGTCVPAMLEQGLAATLGDCMAGIQDNAGGAPAALAMLQLVQQLAGHCPDQLQVAGILSSVLHMLAFNCVAAEPVRIAALHVLAVLCAHRDRQICAPVAQTVLLPLVQWLCSTKQQEAAAAAAAAGVLTALLDCCVIDEALAVLQGPEQAALLLSLCLKCLSAGQMQQQQQQQILAAPVAPSQAEEGLASAWQQGQERDDQQQWQTQVTGARLLKVAVELDAQIVDALLAAKGLPVLISLLSAVANSISQQTATGSNNGNKSSNGAGSPKACSCGSNNSATQSAAVAANLHSWLVMQHEMLAVLDSLSLCHRQVLVQAAIIPLIVGILRQKLPLEEHQQLHTAGNARTGATATAPGTVSKLHNSASRLLPVVAGTTNSVVSPTKQSSMQSAWSSISRPYQSNSRSRSRRVTASAASSPAASKSSEELLLRCKVIACNLITVLAINNDVKRQLFHSDAVGPLMQLADEVGSGNVQEAIRAALAQLGLVYLMPTPVIAAADTATD